MLITVISARILGPENFGIYIFVLWIIEINFLVFSVGLPGVATRFFPETLAGESGGYQSFSSWFIKHCSFAVFLSAIFSLISVELFSPLRSANSILTIIFFSLSSSLFALMSSRAYGLFQFKNQAISVVLFNLTVLVGLGISGNDLNVISLCLIMAVAYILATCLLVVKNGGPRKGETNTALTEKKERYLSVYAKNSWLTSLGSSLLWSRGEMPLVKSQAGESGVALYSVGLTLSGLVNQLLSLVTGAIWPQIASLWDQDRREELVDLYESVTSLLMLICGFAVGFLICFSDYIVVLLFGTNYVSDSNLISILAIGTLGISSGVGNLLLQASTNGQFSRNVTILGIVSLFTCAFFLVGKYGLEGIASARSFTQLGIAIIVFIYVPKIFKQIVSPYKLLRGFISLVILCLALLIVRASVDDQKFSQLVLLFLVFITLCYYSAPLKGSQLVSVIIRAFLKSSTS